MARVRMKLNYRCWNEGETCGFEGRQLDELLEAGIVELVKEPPVTKAVEAQVETEVASPEAAEEPKPKPKPTKTKTRRPRRGR